MLTLDFTHKGIRVCIWEVKESLNDLYGIAGLTAEDAHDVETRFRAPSRRTEWVATRALLRTVLRRPPAISHKSNGAPFLPDTPGTSISISHTRGFVAVALSERSSVGIDIELLGNQVPRVRDKILTNGETADSTELLHAIWSLKESTYKCLSDDSIEMLRDIKVQCLPADEKGGTAAISVPTSLGKRISDASYWLSDRYVLALVSTDKVTDNGL